MTANPTTRRLSAADRDPTPSRESNPLLGRTDYVPNARDRLGRLLMQLDALASLVYDPEITEEERDGHTTIETGTFQRMNVYMQCEVLGLVADLAAQANELYNQMDVGAGVPK